MQYAETEESWASILKGLAELVDGLAPGLREAGEGLPGTLFDEGDLLSLHSMAPTSVGRAAVLRMAAALPASQAAAELHTRHCPREAMPSSDARVEVSMPERAALYCRALLHSKHGLFITGEREH